MPKPITEICYECGQSVAPGSGRFVNRIPSFDTFQQRKQNGVPFQKGEYIYHDCDIKIRDKRPNS